MAKHEGQAPQLSDKEREKLAQAQALISEATRTIQGGVTKIEALVIGFVTKEDEERAKHPRRR